MKAVLRRRRWLNRPGYGAGAHIIATVWPEDVDSVIATVTIADCVRSVTLEFDSADVERRANALHKFDVLTNVLHETRDAFERASDHDDRRTDRRG